MTLMWGAIIFLCGGVAGLLCGLVLGTDLDEPIQMGDEEETEEEEQPEEPEEKETYLADVVCTNCGRELEDGEFPIGEEVDAYACHNCDTYNVKLLVKNVPAQTTQA